MESLQVLPENIESVSLPELYDLLAEETVKFNRMLLQKTPKEELTILKNTIKKIQQEIYRKRATH